MTRFVAIDVETANAQFSSICQMGAVLFERGVEVACWSTLVNPQAEFREFNIRLHGIDAAVVRGAPTFAQALQDLCQFADGTAVMACYGHFDRAAVTQAQALCDLAAPPWSWVDVAVAVQHVWPQNFSGRWRLKMVCAHLDIALENHHDALADARAAGLVFSQAQRASNTCAADWLTKTLARSTAAQPGPRVAASHTLPPELQARIRSGALQGKRVVFTGELSVPRQIAQAVARAAGAEVASGVTRKTDMVVVGDQDLALVKNAEGKSSKQLRAEELIAQGLPITLMGEMAFWHAVGCEGTLLAEVVGR